MNITDDFVATTFQEGNEIADTSSNRDVRLLMAGVVLLAVVIVTCMVIRLLLDLRTRKRKRAVSPSPEDIVQTLEARDIEDTETGEDYVIVAIQTPSVDLTG